MRCEKQLLCRSSLSESNPSCAIVLAGRRSVDDPLAAAANAPHRALLDIDGEPMLARVVDRLLGRPGLDRVLINIDEPDLLHSLPRLAAQLASGRVDVMKSTDSPSRSVLESLGWANLDDGATLVTTADHALLDDSMLDAFFRDSAKTNADLTLALVPRTTIEARFPETKRTYLRFRNEHYSGANLFLFRNPRAALAAKFWRRVESQRKRPWRIARAFGYGSLLLFLTRQLDLAAAFERVSSVIGAQIEAVPLEIAEAAIDVDKIEDLELVRQILSERQRAVGTLGVTQIDSIAIDVDLKESLVNAFKFSSCRIEAADFRFEHKRPIFAARAHRVQMVLRTLFGTAPDFRRRRYADDRNFNIAMGQGHESPPMFMAMNDEFCAHSTQHFAKLARVPQCSSFGLTVNGDWMVNHHNPKEPTLFQQNQQFLKSLQLKLAKPASGAKDRRRNR